MASYCRDAYGLYPAFIFQHGASRPSNARRVTGRRCGDRSGSSKPRDQWWSCNEPLTGALVSQQGCFRCPAHAHMSKRNLQILFEAQRAAEEKKDDSAQQGGAQQDGAQQGGAPQGGAQQGGAQQDGAQQGGAQQGGIQVRVHNLCVSVGVDPNGSLVDLVAVLEARLIGNVQAGTLMTRIAALEALVG